MKILNKILFIVAATFIISACNKPYDNYEDYIDNPDSYNVLYMALAEKSPYNLDLDIAGKDTVINLGVNFGGLGYPKQDIKAEISIRSELVDTYNSENYTDYEILDEKAYSISTDPVIISEGKLTSTPFKITLKPSELKGLGSYLLPIRLDATNSDIKIKENLRTIYLIVKGTYVFFDRSNWEVIDYSSQEDSGVENDHETGLERGWAYCAIDGNIETYWHSRWQGGEAPLPHWIIIDMKEKKEIRGFEVGGRIAVGQPTYPSDYACPTLVKVYAGNDGTTWENSEEFVCENPKIKLWHLFYFSTIVEARYIKLEILDVTRPPWDPNGISVTVSEFNVF